jgi:hypothetical protein
LDWNINLAAPLHSKTPLYSTAPARSKSKRSVHQHSLSKPPPKPPAETRVSENRREKQTAPHQEGHYHAGPIAEVPLQHHALRERVRRQIRTSRRLPRSRHHESTKVRVRRGPQLTVFVTLLSFLVSFCTRCHFLAFDYAGSIIQLLRSNSFEFVLACGGCLLQLLVLAGDRFLLNVNSSLCSAKFEPLAECLQVLDCNRRVTTLSL